MTEQVRVRLDKSLAKEFGQVCESIGITPTQAVSMLASQMVKLRGLPFRPSELPILEEYGVTLEQLEKTGTKTSRETDVDQKSGKLAPRAKKATPLTKLVRIDGHLYFQNKVGRDKIAAAVRAERDER